MWRTVRLALVKTKRREDKKTRALQAIAARIHGDWDNPALCAIGPLTTDLATDCLSIAAKGLSVR